MVFSAVSRVSSFEADNGTDDSVGTGQGKKMYASLCHIDAVQSRMKMEQGKLCCKADLSKKKCQMEWSGTLHWSAAFML